MIEPMQVPPQTHQFLSSFAFFNPQQYVPPIYRHSRIVVEPPPTTSL